MKQVLIIFFVMLFVLNLFTQDIEQNREQPEKAIKVEVRNIELGTFKEYTNYEGEIYPYKEGDNSIMKIVLQTKNDKMISESQDISISFKEVKGNFSWKKPSRGSNILVSNENLKLSPGMKVIVRVLTKIHKNIIILSKDEILKDKKGSYVFIVDKSKAKKVYLSIVYTHEHKVLVKSGLSVKDEFIVFEILSSRDSNLRKKIENIRDGMKIEIMDKDPVYGKYRKREISDFDGEKVEKNEKSLKNERKRKTEKIKIKGPEKKENNLSNKYEIESLSDEGSDTIISQIKNRLDFEISFGFLRPGLKEIYFRDSGIGSLVDQYARFYNVTPSSSGEFEEIKFMLPFNFIVNYNLKKNFYLKLGFELSSKSISSEKSYQLTPSGMAETHKYNLKNKVGYLMPFVGFEARVSSFGFYANLGMNFATFSHTQNFNYSENNYSQEREDKFDVKGSGMSVVVGGKYMYKIGKKIRVLIKLEYFYSKIKSLNGDKFSTGSNSLGESFSESILDGTLYSFEMNPYEMGWINYWDMYKSLPNESWIKNPRKLLLDLSSIRLMIGFSF